MKRLMLLLMLLAGPPALAATPAWVARSDANAMVLLNRQAAFFPEDMTRVGLEGFDDQVIDLGPDHEARLRKAMTEAMTELERRRAAEPDRSVRQDLDILIHRAREDIRGSELGERYEVPYFAVGELVFDGLNGLLDDRIAPARRQLAVARLRRYAGLEPGATPLTELAQARTRERLNVPGLLMPIRAELQKQLGNTAAYLRGIEELFTKFQLNGWREPFAKLKEQLLRYDGFVKAELLPKARDDFRLPPELYAFRLGRVGVDIAPAELAAQAHAAFDDIQKQMEALAPKVAAQHHLATTDYREVIAALKKEQWTGAAILPHYQARLHEMETIITQQHLVTLPARPARIRLASEAESAQTPSPHMRPPRLLHNTGEIGEFVLPLNVPAPPGAKQASQRLDDFTHQAASWSLTAHEARPGHELQFAAMVERGVSLARAVFAFNSTNAEGWGLYSEHIMLPFMPPDGQLISLQFRLQRAARAFLDPELQAGKVTREQAKQVLLHDVGLSEGMANSEVERYTFRAPGQATSYFYGYTRLIQLRHEVERALGPRFDAQHFHDFVLAEGLLPPGLLRQAVLEGFVPPASHGNRAPAP
jgi:hypothetical protein